MKRLLRISFDTALLSFIPVISWFLLGIIVDKNLTNIFTLTYPIQFIYYILKAIFSVGANISKERDKNNNAVMSGLVIGTLVSAIIFSIILINVDNYIEFMNMDVNIYKNFTIYSILQLFICLEFAMVLDKLYYEGKNKTANKYSLFFNLLNFILLIGTSLITKNQIIIITSTLIPLAIFTLYIYINITDTFRFKLNILNCIKYDSVEVFNNIAFFLIFLFGFSNALEYGEQYAMALTFVALITDTQWDTINSILTVAKIDISKKQFNYKQHIANAYKLLMLLFTTIFLMFIVLHNFYNLNLKITMIYLSFEIINFIIYPIYMIKTCYLQLEWSPVKITANKVFASSLRCSMSFLKTPFCTGIGQIFSSFYQFITLNIFFKLNYKIDKYGYVVKKSKKQKLV